MNFLFARRRTACMGVAVLIAALALLPVAFSAPQTSEPMAR